MRVKDEVYLCGLGIWVVGNFKSFRGEIGFEMLSLILSMLFKRRCLVSSWIWGFGGEE